MKTPIIDTDNIAAPEPKRTVFGMLRRWFFAGILVSAPILLSGYVTWLLINLIDGYAAKLVPSYFDPSTYTKFPIPGIGIVFGVTIIILIGALTTGLLGRTLIKFGEKMLSRVPVIRSLYGATKQILETVMASQSDAFREVVLIEYPRRGIWAIGFVTGTTKGEVQNISSENLINIFVPTTPNPTSGFLLFFPRSETISLDMGVEEAVKMVVSGGIVTPSDPRANRTAAPLDAVKKKSAKKKAPKKKASKKRT
ncbi:MAG: DUF502 domain-containing protein [Candidatus Puniceispirillales bacterium WSBS_2018_MAG_OTU23]